MRLALLAAALLLPLTAQAADESVVSIESSAGTWRLTCAWEGETAVDRRGEGDQVFRFPPGRLDCIIALEQRGALKLDAVGAAGSTSAIRFVGSGRSRFSLR